MGAFIKDFQTFCGLGFWRVANFSWRILDKWSKIKFFLWTVSYMYKLVFKYRFDSALERSWKFKFGFESPKIWVVIGQVLCSTFFLNPSKSLPFAPENWLPNFLPRSMNHKSNKNLLAYYRVFSSLTLAFLMTNFLPELIATLRYFRYTLTI